MNQAMNQEKRRVLELLTWLRDNNLQPEKFGREDLFVIQVVGRLTSWSHVTEAQERFKLWVPTPEKMVDVLNWNGYICELVEGVMEDSKWVSFRGREETLIGIGPDRTTATLNALEQLRESGSCVGASP
ncbi:unnamed protein product [marine sediment metagenome]|uniref:Uncharacterized protein n=1 Tax=marine sediment metagenome TaxID=412755 RepID=X1CJ56_9ZZZZ